MRIHLLLAPVVFFSAGILMTAAPSLLGADPQPILQLRQRIIRAPEADVVATLEKKLDDDAVAKLLLQWVEGGTAKVVSDVSTVAKPGDRYQVKDGKVHKTVIINSQNPDAPVLTPTHWEDVFIGTSLEGGYQKVENEVADSGFPSFGGPPDPDYPPGSKYPEGLHGRTEFRPHLPLKVRWPLVWPENKKPEVGLYEQDDFLVQRAITSMQVHPGHPTILAIMRPALDLESEPPTRELDVVLLQATDSKTPAPSPEDTAIRVPTPRVMLYGFGVNDAAALELLGSRDPKDDATLLARLQSLARDGKAARRLVCGTQITSHRSTIETVREHSYPTEMQTIPSAWSMCPVGTRVEMDLIGRTLTLALDHHPARFRWAEWICALDAPELIMRQPQFFVQRIQTVCEFPESNVLLVSAMRTPESLTGSGKGPAIGETLLLFAELDLPSGSKPVRPQPFDSPEKNVDLEAIVFDLPAAEAAGWNCTPTKAPVDDELRYRKALGMVKAGTAKVPGRLTVATQTNHKAAVQTVEEVLFVVEYNPVDHNPAGRYRPTALDMQPVGSIWEVDLAPVLPDSNAGSTPMIVLKHVLHHDALPAVQPALKEALKFALDHSYELPKPLFTVDEWQAHHPSDKPREPGTTENFAASIMRSTQGPGPAKEGSVNLIPGKARCLGIVRPEGAEFKDRIHIAFVRAVVR